MAVSKVIIICVIIGFLLGLVSNHPIQRRSGNANKYFLPRTLREKDAFDIKLFNYTKNLLVIRLVTNKNETAYTVKLDKNVNADSDRDLVFKSNFKKFEDGSTVAVKFTVRQAKNSDVTDMISIGGPVGSIDTIKLKDFTIDDIEYFTVTGVGEEDVDLSELTFMFKVQ